MYDFMNSFILYSSLTSSKLLLTERAVYYSSTELFYLVETTQRDNDTTLLHVHCSTRQKIERKTEQKTWPQWTIHPLIFLFFFFFLALAFWALILKARRFFYWSWRGLYVCVVFISRARLIQSIQCSGRRMHFRNQNPKY